MALLPEEFLPDKGTESRMAMEADMEPGMIRDRRQEIVIIGSDLNKEAITKAFDDCLLKEEDNENAIADTNENASLEDIKENGWKFGWKAKEGEENPMPTWPDPKEMIEQLFDFDEDQDEDETPEKESNN